MPEGLIVKALSGFYEVRSDCSSEVICCRGRGIFKNSGQSLLVGDHVVFSKTDNKAGIVERVLPRTSELVRPPIANASLAVLVFSLVHPALNLLLLDKFLVHIEKAGLEVLIVFSKRDLIPKNTEGQRLMAQIKKVKDLYRSLGYTVVQTSIYDTAKMEFLQQKLGPHINVLAGQSGVGKSSLLNVLVPNLQLKTSEISAKLGRGKHTTRHVELVALTYGGYLADTPGFSRLDFTSFSKQEIGFGFPEFRLLQQACKFRECEHTHEPYCAVLEKLKQGSIAQSRYDHYLNFIEEFKEMKRRF